MRRREIERNKERDSRDEERDREDTWENTEMLQLIWKMLSPLLSYTIIKL